ncbi:hypothetical protein [Phenylobacterium sp.]|uniref:hypothetical protein n=1 Tax=Phenylobacterium sp. TaxID=1871053 RepID=UPI002DE61443|nr:hypothetical protein [Phenylobacterium sp.]
MIIQISPDAPLLVKLAANTALALHIGGGITAVVAGGAALMVRKGGRLHRLAGDLFMIGMLVAMTIAAITAPLLPQLANVPGAILAIYLITTAWVTVRRPPNAVGVFEVGAFLAATAATVALGAFAWTGANSPHGMIDGVPYQAALFIGVFAALAAGFDLRVILRGGVSGPQRLARHLWRMCFALFFGTGSFFIGQPQVFPAPLRGSPILILAGVAPLLAMIYWLVRVQSRARRRPLLAAAAA